MFTRGAGLTLSLGMAAAASPAAAAETPSRTFKITDFGAVGDGRANDTAAFERAIAAARSAGSGLIEIPPGTFSVSDLWLGQNGNGKRPSVNGIHLKGAGMGTTVLVQRSSNGSMGCINLVDARLCSVRDLTVDSSAVGDGLR